MIADRDRKPLWMIWFPVVAVAIFYAPGFSGYWLGDDFANLHRAYAQAQQGTLWPETLRVFFTATPSEGAFYRPMMVLSITLNYVLASEHFSGWYLFNLAVHLLNTWLVALVVRRIAIHAQCDATFAAPLAALLFGLCPSVAEGVYWMSARADGIVTLLSLAGLYCWASATASASARSAYILPMLHILALGFKESAAVVPLQMALLAFAWPGSLSRSQRWSVCITFVAAGIFLAWRAYLFGNAWNVYTPQGGTSLALHTKLQGALMSLGPWWTALGSATPTLSKLYVACCATAILLAVCVRPAPQWKMALALAAASGGLALATLLNLGMMSSNGEGGRLTYGPVAWLALAVGVIMSRPQVLPLRELRSHPFAMAVSLALVGAVATGSVVLAAQLRAVWAIQASMRALAQSVPQWAESHPGLTMLLVPDHAGHIVMSRNAQASLVLEPIQQQPYLHRVLPTLRSEVLVRQQQLGNGLAQQLETIRPRLADAGSLTAILAPAPAGWPKHIACWSKSQQKIVALKPPPTDVATAAWATTVGAAADNCHQ